MTTIMTEQTEKEKKNPRLSGILVHPTSFPSPYGIGDLGKGAYEFIDFLVQSGQHLWQVLPLGPTGFGDSPYQGFSSFAGQPLIISIDNLIELHLLTEEDLEDMPQWDPRKVEYGKVISFKTALYQKAYASFCHTPNKMLLEEFDDFLMKNSFWLDDYCLFMAGKDAHDGKCWIEWEDELSDPTPTEKEYWSIVLKDEIRYYQFIQFIFYRQWTQLKQYANDNGIKIIGDIPIFVAYDSADVWANKKLFKLDSKGYPTSVAGVPPDYFSATGQLWGNPLYDWDYHKETGYKWWLARIQQHIALFDYLRIDHFRGFEAYWEVPAGEETAINGEWVKGPNEDLFLAIQEALGDQLPIFAEDLGVITPEVEWLRDMFHFPGMKILQFAFEGLEESSYLPHQFTHTNCICYTGTHDNNTTVGWYQTLGEDQKDKLRRYANTDGNNISLDMIRMCLGSIAQYAIFPIQDLLQLGTEARMNTPGIAEDNWAFRYLSEDLETYRAEWLKQNTILYGRSIQ